MQCVEMDGPVTLWDILVMPGDLIVADDSGVCAIPYEYAGQVLGKVLSILKEEEHMRELIFGKAPLEELRPLYRQRYKK